MYLQLHPDIPDPRNSPITNVELSSFHIFYSISPYCPPKKNQFIGLWSFVIVVLNCILYPLAFVDMFFKSSFKKKYLFNRKICTAPVEKTKNTYIGHIANPRSRLKFAKSQ